MVNFLEIARKQFNLVPGSFGRLQEPKGFMNCFREGSHPTVKVLACRSARRPVYDRGTESQHLSSKEPIPLGEAEVRAQSSAFRVSGRERGREEGALWSAREGSFSEPDPSRAKEQSGEGGNQGPWQGAEPNLLYRQTS